MVEQNQRLDTIFASLADPIRRDILTQVATQARSVSEIAKSYDLTFAAIAKHVTVLEKAQLVSKHRHGKEQLVQLSPHALKNASEYLRHYQNLWETRLDHLEEFLANKK